MLNKIILLIKDSTTQKSLGYSTTCLAILLSLSLNLISCTCGNPPLKDQGSVKVNGDERVQLESSDIQLELKDIQHDQATDKITYTVANRGKKLAEGVNLHWKISTPGAEIEESGTIVNQSAIGKLDAEVEKVDQALGQLFFGADPQVEISFWLGLTDDTTQYNPQVMIFTNVKDSLALLAISPTYLTGDSNRTFVAKIEQKAGRGLLNLAKIELKIKRILGNNAKILYDSKEAVSLLGTELTDISKPLSFVVDPGTEKRVSFDLELTYHGSVRGRLRFSWSKEAPQSMFEAISRNDLEALENFLKTAGNQGKLNANNSQGHTLLTYAIASLSEDQALPFVKLLLANKVQVNSPNDTTRMAPLHYAVKDNREKITDLLLAVPHIDVSLQDKDFNTVFHYAAYLGNEEILKKLLNKLPEVSAKGVLNTLNSLGDTCLQGAVYNSLESSVSLLLKKGIDPNVSDSKSGAPLYWGVAQKNLFIVAKLIDFGANVNAENENGDTPLHQAVFTGNVNITKLLLQSGAKKGPKNKTGLKPVDCFTKFIAEADKKEIERLLNS